MPYRSIFYLLFALLVLHTGCSSNQSVKNVWKGTKNVWYSHVNVPAAIDYGDTGKMSDYELLFAKAMMGIDVQLLALERTMQNADKPPTPEWVNAFFTQFSWVDGIVGLNGEGGVVGQAGRTERQLDFSALLESDPKQNPYALRGCVQDSDSGPMILLAVPLYDGSDFLGIIVAYFEMYSLMRYSDASESLIITSPDGVLWSGSSAGTLPSADWKIMTRNSSSGTVSDGSSAYQWVSRFLGNYPLVFAVQKTSSSKTPKRAKAEIVPEQEPSANNPNSAPAFGTVPVDGAGNTDPYLPPLPKL